jgi:PPOX class probable F420-dependent enzyme
MMWRLRFFAVAGARGDRAAENLHGGGCHMNVATMTERASQVAIPTSFLDLVNGPPVAALATVMPDGRPQSTVVWCNFDGTHMLVNTMRGFRKERNMRLNPKVTLFCYDPCRPARSIEVRGTVVEMTEVGALEHLDSLTELYTGRSPYFGTCVPAELKETEIPVLCKILPTHVVTLDAR